MSAEQIISILANYFDCQPSTLKNVLQKIIDKEIMGE